jgi:toxin ParE1/3/4
MRSWAAVALSPLAKQDLIGIGDYIAQDSRAGARRFVGKLQEQCRRIGCAPLAYASREDLAPALRMAPLGNYVVFFRVLDRVVRIERVLHASRDLPVIFAGEKKEQ